MKVDFEALEQFPRCLGNVIAIVPADAHRRRPGDGGFALVEHLWHLADLEREGFGQRIRRLLTEVEPFLPDFAGDATARERQYLERTVGNGLQSFVSGRDRNLMMLRGVSGGAWSRAGVQEQVGAVTLADVPASMLRHDLAHANEIVLLLKEVGVPVPEELEEFAAREPMARSA